MYVHFSVGMHLKVFRIWFGFRLLSLWKLKESSITKDLERIYIRLQEACLIIPGALSSRWTLKSCQPHPHAHSHSQLSVLHADVENLRMGPGDEASLAS